MTAGIKVLVQTVDLESYLVECCVAEVNSSNLLSHFREVLSMDVAPVHIAYYSQLTCSFKKGFSFLTFFIPLHISNTHLFLL